jgi:hypothetical protein
LQINANVSNLFSQQIAQRIYSYYNRENVYLSDAEMLAGFDYIQEYEKHGGQLDPQFLMPNTYTDGIDIRLGIKFIF